MDNLLCDEVLPPMTPNSDVNSSNLDNNIASGGTTSFYSTKQDYEEAFRNFLGKELTFMPQQGYLAFVESNHLIQNARFKAVNWFIKSQWRMNLPTGTTFNAVNYFDRFVSRNQCHGWKYVMFELLSVACLSVASKFNETTLIPLPDFQVEGLDNSFESSHIQKMELELLRTLQWRMDCITPFSYIELILNIIDFKNKSIVKDLTSLVTELLLNTFSDNKFLEFRPSVIALSAFRYICEDLSAPTNMSALFENFIPEDQKDDLIKCERIMGELLGKGNNNNNMMNGETSSPVTVLYNCASSSGGNENNIDDQLILSSTRKRKREEEVEKEVLN